MAARARELIEMRERERIELKEKLLKQHFIENCDVIRDGFSKKIIKNVVEDRNKQVKLKN